VNLLLIGGAWQSAAGALTVPRLLFRLQAVPARFILLAALWLTRAATAAISVTFFGSAAQTFDSLPPATEWSTRAIAGAAGEIQERSGLDAMVQTNDTGFITNALVTPFQSSCCSGSAIWASNKVLFPYTAMSRANGDTAALLLTTLRNDTGTTISHLKISCEISVGAFTREEMGIRLYWSTSGSPFTWQFLQEFTNSQRLELVVNLDAWSAGGTLYLLWADDNASGEPDTAYAIDNFFARPVAPPLGISRPDLVTMQLNWPLTATSNVLELITNIADTNWQALTNADSASGGFHHVNVSAEGVKFFRLRSQQ
jgi:hypothetical protein